MVVETPGLSLAAVFRTGWANQGRDTIWEYISDSFTLSSQARKALSRWSHRIGDVIHGGQPPSFDDIGGYRGLNREFPTLPPPLAFVRSEIEEGLQHTQDLIDGLGGKKKAASLPPDAKHEKLRQFADVLFKDDVEHRWHPNVRELLVMTFPSF